MKTKTLLVGALFTALLGFTSCSKGDSPKEPEKPKKELKSITASTGNSIEFQWNEDGKVKAINVNNKEDEETILSTFIWETNKITETTTKTSKEGISTSTRTYTLDNGLVTKIDGKFPVTFTYNKDRKIEKIHADYGEASSEDFTYQWNKDVVQGSTIGMVINHEFSNEDYKYPLFSFALINIEALLDNMLANFYPELFGLPKVINKTTITYTDEEHSDKVTHTFKHEKDADGYYVKTTLPDEDHTVLTYNWVPKTNN